MTAENLVNNIEFHDEEPAPLTPRPGRVYSLSNENRFTAGTVSAPLSDRVNGFASSADVKKALDLVAPETAVDSRRFSYKTFETSSGLSEVDDARAVGGTFKRVDLVGVSAEGKTANRGLTTRLEPDWPDVIQAAIAELLTARLFLNELRRAISIIETAIGIPTPKTWNGSSDPDADVLEAIETAATARCLAPNAVLYGSPAWRVRHSAYRASTAAAGIAGALLTPSALAEILDVDQVAVIRKWYKTAAATAANALASKVLILASSPNDAILAPSTLKRFVAPTANGGRLAVHLEQNGPFRDLSVELYSVIVCTCSTGVAEFTVASS